MPIDICMFAGRYWSRWSHCIQWTRFKPRLKNSRKNVGCWNGSGQCQVFWWRHDESSESGTDSRSWHSYGCKGGIYLFSFICLKSPTEGPEGHLYCRRYTYVHKYTPHANVRFYYVQLTVFHSLSVVIWIFNRFNRHLNASVSQLSIPHIKIKI